MSNLDGINRYSDYSITEIIEDNIVQFMAYGFLELGAYHNVALDQMDYKGQNESRLVPVNYTGIASNRLYTSQKSQWVWEQDISLKSSQSAPTYITGININGTTFGLNDSVSGRTYHIDYARGLLVFSSSIPSSWVVKMPHSRRNVQVFAADSTQYRTLTSDWLKTFPSGEYGAKEQAYLPAIFIQVSNYDTVRGLELGSRGKLSNFEIQFDIFANNRAERRKLTDLCYMLETKAFYLYDSKNVSRPLNISGAVINISGTWPNFINSNRLGIARFTDRAKVTQFAQNILPILHTRIRIGLELDTYPY